LTADHAKLTRLLEEVENAKAEADRLFQEAMNNPGNRAIKDRMWKAVERQAAAMRVALEERQRKGPPG
jgi:hypothetical protein